MTTDNSRDPLIEMLKLWVQSHEDDLLVLKDSTIIDPSDVLMIVESTIERNDLLSGSPDEDRLDELHDYLLNENDAELIDVSEFVESCGEQAVCIIVGEEVTVRTSYMGDSDFIEDEYFIDYDSNAEYINEDGTILPKQ